MANISSVGFAGLAGMLGSFRIPKNSITTGAPSDKRDENNLSAASDAGPGRLARRLERRTVAGINLFWQEQF